MRTLISVLAITAALAACGQPAATTNQAQAQTEAGSPARGEVTAAERNAILSAVNARPNSAGQLENECGEMVSPQFLLADVGAGVGRAVAFIMDGGPNTAACYGDGPLTILMRNDGGAWREIYQNRGGGLIILSSLHNNSNDLADGGPGFSFPVWQWNGTAYENANRQVADSALSDARFLP